MRATSEGLTVPLQAPSIPVTERAVGEETDRQTRTRLLRGGALFGLCQFTGMDELFLRGVQRLEQRRREASGRAETGAGVDVRHACNFKINHIDA